MSLICYRYKGVCDKDGCDFHTWRLGNKNFYGEGGNFQVIKEIEQNLIYTYRHLSL